MGTSTKTGSRVIQYRIAKRSFQYNSFRDLFFLPYVLDAGKTHFGKLACSIESLPKINMGGTYVPRSLLKLKGLICERVQIGTYLR